MDGCLEGCFCLMVFGMEVGNRNDLCIPGAQMTSIFEGQTLQKQGFQLKLSGHVRLFLVVLFPGIPSPTANSLPFTGL